MCVCACAFVTNKASQRIHGIEKRLCGGKIPTIDHTVRGLRVHKDICDRLCKNPSCSRSNFNLFL